MGGKLGSASSRPPIASNNIWRLGSGCTAAVPFPRPLTSVGPGSQFGGDVASAQKKRTQLPVVQSVLAVQALCAVHLAVHVPPQSTSVSVPSLTPLPH